MARPPKWAASHFKTQLTEKAGPPKNLPKHCGEHAKPTKPQKGRNNAAAAVPKKGCESNNKLLKLQDLQKIHQNTKGIDGATPKSGCNSSQNTAEKTGSPRNPTKHRGNRWCDGATPSLTFQRFCMVASGSNIKHTHTSNISISGLRNSWHRWHNQL